MDADLAPLVIAVGEDEVVVAAQRACKHRLRNEKTGEGGKIFQHVASIAMSVVLARVNAFVSVETKNLLIGEAASNEMATGVRKLIEAEAAQSCAIRRVHAIRTMRLGANDVSRHSQLFLAPATTDQAGPS